MEPALRQRDNAGDMNSNPRTISKGCAALLIACSLSTALLAQVEPTQVPSPTTTPTPTATAAPTSTVAHSDRSFMRKAANAGAKEIAVSQAVMDHLSNAQAKTFAQQMITDHTQANTELMSLAQQKGVELPAKDDSSLAEDWSKKTGNVDREYAKEMVSDHEEAVKLFEKGSKSEDPDVAAFAQKTLPTLQHHLMMAQELKKATD
jgi:putative membrane protein